MPKDGMLRLTSWLLTTFVAVLLLEDLLAHVVQECFVDQEIQSVVDDG